MATWPLFHALKSKIREILMHAEHIFGYVDQDWLRGVVDRFGPLTHHLQLRASIVLDAINRMGLCVDHQAPTGKTGASFQGYASGRRAASAGWFVVHGPGSAADLQNNLTEFHHRHPEVPLKTTESGKWSTAADDLAELGQFDNRFQELKRVSSH